MGNNKDKLFVGGDLSGIQKFIYNITSYKAAVSLRGRSAWLADYMNGVCDRLCKRLPPEPLTERIYCSGGKFYLITVDNDDIRQIIDAFNKEIEQELWDMHKGLLALSICYVSYVSKDDEQTVTTAKASNQPFTRLFDEVNELFAERKNRKFLSVLNSHYDSMFEVQEVGGTPKVCVVTGTEDENCVKFDKEGDRDIYILPSVKEQITYGNKLRLAEGYKGETFEDYAKGSYLGVLRMDVDGLGQKFRSLKAKQTYQAFSDKLDAFFGSKTHHEFALKDIAAGYKGELTIIYAGGDDIFVVGHWNRVIDFAAQVQAIFEKYFEGDGITLSGGVAIVRPKFPISKAAELAGEAEDASKHFGFDERHKQYQKNAFTFLGTTVSWNNEFDEVLRLKNTFRDYCLYYNMPRSILHRLMILNDLCQRGEMKYMWNTAYFLKRFSEGKNNEIKSLCNELEVRLLSPRKYQLTALATRWAELELKNNNQ